MRIYLDTNVFSFIARTGEAEDIRRFFDKERHTLLASGLHLDEIWPTPNEEERVRKFQALTTIASYFEKRPPSYLHGEELLGELRRRRSEWLEKKPPHDALRVIPTFLAAHNALWKRVQSDPYFVPERFQVYRHDFEAGVRQGTAAQKGLRTAIQQTANTFVVSPGDPDLERHTMGFTDDPELYWRVDCMLVWQGALVHRNPASRDYQDWVGPYVKADKLGGPEYRRFWLEQVQARRMRWNRISSLANYYQLRVSGRITHGNGVDTLHANHLLDTELFLTADKAFYKVLLNLRPHDRQSARVAFVEQSTAGALAAIRDAINSSQPN